MRFENLFCMLSLVMVIPVYAMTLGPNLLNNSPSEYLLDLDKSFQDTTATHQIGNVLYERDYLSTVTTYYVVVADADARPTVPGMGYTFNDGQWMWIPDYIDAQSGTWYWVLRSTSYYVSLFHSIIPIISRSLGWRLPA